MPLPISTSAALMVATSLSWFALAASLAGPWLAHGWPGQVADRVVRSLPPLLETAAERAASRPAQACEAPEGSSAVPPTVATSPAAPTCLACPDGWCNASTTVAGPGSSAPTSVGRQALVVSRVMLWYLDGRGLSI
jgi:hypothetical protein